MEADMIEKGIINPQLGCLDASGAGLASWVNDTYGGDGYVASNQAEVSFDDLAAEAGTGTHPISVGGRAWYHWASISGYDPTTDVLLVKNSAPGYMGVYDTMSRAQFASLGSFSLVRVTNPAAEGVSPAPIPPTPYPVGIDVSSHQKLVDWQAVKDAGASFAFAKASGGAWYRNPYFEAAWNGMKAVGLARGAYAYAFESSGQEFPGPGPEAEADWFLDTVLPLGLGPGDMLVLDIEEGAGPLGAWALAWLRRVESVVGFKPLLYTGAWFAQSHGFAACPELAAYGLWLADWGGVQPSPPAPWTSYPFWQFSDGASVPGVTGYVDANRFMAPLEQLPCWGNPVGLPEPAPPEDAYAPWVGQVGSGLLEQMQAAGVLPAQSASTWLPLGRNPAEIEECMASDGSVFRWVLAQATCYRFYPGGPA
jgi:lysozyme